MEASERGHTAGNGYTGVHRRAKKAIREITDADNKEKAEKAIEAFAKEFSAKAVRH